MILDLRAHGYREGAYGIVVPILNGKRAIKLFHQKQEYEHAKRVFLSELEAYKLAVKDDVLRNFVPAFFGVKTIASVINSSGLDISQEYYCDLAYEMSFEEGQFTKIASTRSKNKLELLHRFGKVGIDHLLDASATVDDNGEITRIIDFATPLCQGSCRVHFSEK